MTPERARLIEELYAKALERDPAQRRTFLHEACHGDNELLHEVESLIAEDSDSGSFLDVPAIEAASREIASRAQSLIGRRLGHYELHELLGAGGMGNVYKATDTRLGRTVALKTLAEHISHLPEAKLRFEREARTIAGLNHPHICVLYDIGHEDRIDFIVMEYLEGITLAERLSTQPLPLNEVAKIASEIGDALDKAHQAGVIHRDLKPANIMLTANGSRLLDFGVAKILGDSAPAGDVTHSGAIIGTPRYIAPEQLDRKPLDARADIFSFGAVLYEMLTGRRAFPDRTLPSRIVPGLPPQLDHIVMRCLAEDPSQRWNSVREMMQEFRAAVQPRRHGRRKAVMIAAALLVAAFGIGIAFRSRAGDSAGTDTDGSPAIAVMPFLNLSADRENEYFSDGLADQLTNALANVPGLVVASRTSAFSLKGKQMEATEIGSKLHVGTILEGSVQKSANKLRVTAQLIRTRDGYHLWSQTFDREFKNVFEIQDEISRAITRALKISLSEEAARNLVKGSTRDPEALDLFLRGQQLLRNYGTGDQPRALALFQRALDRDPHFALAYVGIAGAEGSAGIAESEPPREVAKRARAAAEKALQIDGSLAVAHSILAIIESRVDWNWAAAEQRFRRALALEPRSPEIHAAYAHSILLPFRRYNEAVAECRMAEKLDPAGMLTAVCAAWVHLHQEGKAPLAYAEVEALAKDQPGLPGPGATIFATFTGHEDLTVAMADRVKIDAADLVSQNPNAAAEIAYAYAHTGRTKDALRVVQRMEELSRTQYVSPFAKCVAYVGLDNLDEARKAGAQAIQEHSTGAYWFAFSPLMKPLLADPEFAALVNTMGLPTTTPAEF